MPPYPSNCLQFVQMLEGVLPDFPKPTGKVGLNVLVGAGLGGLATAIALT